jgi:hypothetical protein
MSVSLPNIKGLKRREYRAALSLLLVPRGLLVALVSQFDAYVGALIRQLFKLKPEIVDSSENSLTFSQLTEFGSIAIAREYVIDKEVESVLRKSHSEQFDWLERKFDIVLRKNLPAWPVFVEVTERRNLFVHTNGVVSHQYLEVCRKHSSKVPSSVYLGESLTLTTEYFAAAHECLLEIGVKLGQVLWRKIQPSQLGSADDNLTGVTFNLIVEGRYQLAGILLDFATEILKKHSSEVARLTLVVNRAQTYKWTGQEEQCKQILNAEDWSATSFRFKLADAVLRDDFKKANEMVVKLGKDGDVGMHDYRDWPLFKEFRKSPEFVSLFEQIFGEPLNKITFEQN